MLFKKYDIIKEKFEQQLYNLRTEIDDILELSENSINISVKIIEEVRQDVIRKGFKKEAEEIYFFKNIKPRFVFRLIYHISVYNLEANRPNGSIKIKRKYLQAELNKLKSFFDDNLDFYRYFRTSSTYLDHKYFVRGRQDIRLRLDSRFYESDPSLRN